MSSCRAGITTRPEERKQEWESQYPGMRNWQEFGPFPDRDAAQKWEDQQPCDKHEGGREPDYPGARWFGYRFDY